MSATNRKLVAYHESGHALMAALSPYHVPGETILRVEERKISVSEGCSSYATIQHNETWTWRIAAGGGAGERILQPKADVFGFGEDFLSPTAARLDLITCGVELFDLGDEDDPEVIIRREKRALNDVCRLVRRNAESVRKIAAFLMAQGRIDGATVRSIVGPALPLPQPRKPKPQPVDPRQSRLFEGQPE